MKPSKLPAYLIFSTCLIMSSCFLGNGSSIKLPANPVLTGGLGWAVVKESYVRLKERPSDVSKDLDHLRRGAIFHIDGRDFGSRSVGSRAQNNQADIWYCLDAESSKGWARASELDVYASQAQAEKAQAAYK